MRRVVLGPILVALLLAAGALGAGASGYYRSRDFYAIWSGARLVAAGIDPYDEVRWCAETHGVSVDATSTSGEIVCKVRYAYPLWTAVLLLPLGVLPLTWASSLWLSLSIAATLAAVALAWRAVEGTTRGAPLFCAVALGSQPFWLMMAGGQISGVLALGVALSAYAASRRERLSGAALVISALKPNVLALAAAAAVLQAVAVRARAFLLGATAALLALFALSLPVRLGWPFEWLHELFGRQIGHATEFATAWGIGARDLGSLAWGGVLVAIVVTMCLWLAKDALRDRVTLLALAVPLSLFATPYAWSYDFVVLVLPWAFVLARSERSSPARRALLRWALIAIASPLGWLLYLLAFSRGTETLSASLPALTALLVSVAARAPQAASERPTAARRAPVVDQV